MRKVKTILVIIIALILVSNKINAQLIHVDGSKALGLNGGFVKNGFSISTRLSLYDKNSFTFRGNIDFESLKVSLSEARNFYVNPEAMYTMYYVGDNLFFSVKTGVIIGVELLSNSVLKEKRNSFILGENLGFCVEYFINQRIMLNFDLDQRFFQMSKLGTASYVVKLGINYNF